MMTHRGPKDKFTPDYFLLCSSPGLGSNAFLLDLGNVNTLAGLAREGHFT